MLFSLLFAALPEPTFGPKTEIRPVPFAQVKLRDGFWDKRIKLNHEVTIWHEIKMCEDTKRIDNFRAAVGAPGFKHEGYLFNDSDVYKVIEAAAYILNTEDDPKLEAKMDEWIDLIGRSQEVDGYLQSQVSASRFTDKPMSRWANDFGEHELYNVGHFYEAAVAYHLATGKRAMLDIAIKNADLVCKTFNLKGKRHAPGHQQIEMGLVTLYQHTGDKKYLGQAKHFLDERGSKEGRAQTYGEYSQDHLPVLQQEQAVGHSVRAAYQYCGMIDVGTHIGDSRYVEATKRIWDDVIKSKIYLTGGIGSSGSNEGFAKEYELPNLSGYAETCASIANIMWNQRLFQVTGDGKYIDVLERSLYNAFLSGYGADGKSFFYPNPLQSIHGADRQAWFACACCPPNVARLLPRVPELMYATDSKGIYVNLLAAGDAEMQVKGQPVRLQQRGEFPVKDTTTITVRPEKPVEMTIRIRIPGWTRNVPMPGDLYVPVANRPEDFEVLVLGKPVKSTLNKGYLEIKRTWRSGDEIKIRLGLEPQWIKSNPKLKENEGLVAMQVGPFVYCAEQREQHDNEPEFLKIFPPLHSKFLKSLEAQKAALPPNMWTGERGALPKPWGELPVYALPALYAERKTNGSVAGLSASSDVFHPGSHFQFIPYFAWANQGRNAMSVWIPTSAERTMPLKAPTIAALSRITASEGSKDTVAINDQLLPKASVDQSVPNQHWWPKKGTKEWVDFAFDGLREVSSIQVYWFDDTNVGECRVPKSWRLMAQVDGQWREVSTSDSYGVKLDGFNKVRFSKVTASNLRLELEMQPGWSTGIHEVVIE